MYKVGDRVVVTYKSGPYNVENYQATILSISIAGYRFKAPSMEQGNPYPENGPYWTIGINSADKYFKPFPKYPLVRGDTVFIRGTALKGEKALYWEKHWDPQFSIIKKDGFFQSILTDCIVYWEDGMAIDDIHIELVKKKEGRIINAHV